MPDIARVSLPLPGLLRIGLQPSAKQTRLRIRISAGVQLLRLSQNAAQILGAGLRVLVNEVHAHRLAVYDRKRMAWLEAGLPQVGDMEEPVGTRHALLAVL